MLRPGLVLAALVAAVPAAGQTPALNEAAKAMVGSWEFSNADRDKRCTVTFKADRSGSGYKVEFEPKCVEDFPLLRDITAWTYPDNDLLHMLDTRGKSVINFSEVETGMFEAPTPGIGVLFLQNSADVASAPILPDQVIGDWAVVRGTGKPLCTITLSLDPAEEGFALAVKPGCDPAIARLGFNRWRLDRDELMLSPARGNPWRFEQNDPNNWERTPESSNPYKLVRQ